MAELVDIHQHFLYGLDDGAQTKEQMADMLKQDYLNGIRGLIATPHVTPGIRPTDAERMALRLREAKALCAASGWNIQLYQGAEILYTPALLNVLDREPLPTLGDTSFVLVEFAPALSFEEIEHAVFSLNGHGYAPIIAHVERYHCFRRKMKLLITLKKESAVYFQVNSGSLLGENGCLARRWVRRLADLDSLDFLASDAHDTGHRKCTLAQAMELLGDCPCRRSVLENMRAFCPVEQTAEAQTPTMG